MNIPQRMMSSQPMGVPDIRVQDHYPSAFGHDRSRTLPRAIPNSQDAPPPGIPSMEAPAAIFGDYRQNLPTLSSVDFSVGTPRDERKGGISSLRERMHHFEAMQLDTPSENSRASFGNPPYQSTSESHGSLAGRFGRVDELRPLPTASVASTNE